MEARYEVTVGLSDPVYQTARQLAEARGISLAEFAQEAIAEKTRIPLTTDLAEAYEILADDPEGSDVEIFFAAQAEAVAE